MDAFTPRNVAKFVFKALVASKASNMAEDVITNHTQFEEGDTVVNISSGVIGWYVADKLKPYTDSMVDKTADFIVAKREARNAKKNNTEVTE